MKWSQEQQTAIDIINKNITISAGAGAGKTAVLIARLTKRIIKDHISVDNILAITFTEAAASEIKKRLTNSLANEYLKLNDSYIQKQMSLLASANISTIHSFCLYVIKNYYYVIGIDKDATNNILDPAMANFYKNTALTKLYEKEASKKDNSLYELSRLISGYDLEYDALSNTIMELANAALSTIDYDQWLDDCAAAYQSYKSINDLPKNILDIFWEIIERNYYYYFKNITDLNNNINDPYVNQRFIHAKEIDIAINNRDYSLYLSLYKKNIEMNIPLKHTDPSYVFLSNAEKKFQEISKNLFKEDILLQDIANLKKAANKLVELTKAFIQEYHDIKKNNKIMDFEDMERFAYKIINADNMYVAHKLQEQFIDIMVDEYQDTNTLQDSMINAISRGNNVFRVGDIKQSIYRFRKAKPEIMQKLIDTPNKQHEIVFLNNNYRSKDSIISFNNQLFKQLMNVEGYKNRYSIKDSGTFGTEIQNKNLSPVEIHLLAIDDIDSINNNQLKASYIAHQIKSLHDTNTEIKWNDFCILVTTHAIKDTIRIALDQLNIPSFGKGSAGLFQSKGVLAIINYLKLIVNENDALALVGVLTSFYHYSDNDLSKLVNDKSLFQSLSSIDNIVFQDIARIRKLAETSSIFEIITEISLINNYYENENNDQQRANIDLMYETILQFETKSNSISELLTLIIKLTDNDLNEAIAIGEDEDVVKIMTIHQSKGLQFKHVIFFSINRKRSFRKDSLIYLNSNLGFSLPVCDKPYRLTRNDIFTLAIKEKEIQDALEESIRILYVALTRAEDKLTIVDFLPKDEISSVDSDLLNTHNYTSWIITALNNIDDNLYRKVVINEKWDTIKAQDVIHPKFQYSRFINSVKTNSFISPSDTEITNDIYDLDFSNKLAANKLGTQIHHVFEILPNRSWSDSEINSLLNDDTKVYFDSIKFFNLSDLYQKICTMNVYKEAPFVVNKDNNIIHGFIDLLALDDSEAIIIDFKTDNDATVEILKKRYSQQIILYLEAIQLIYPKIKVKAYIYALTLKSFIQIT